MTIAGLDAYPPDFLLGILVEVAPTVPQLSASRVDSLRYRGRAGLETRRADKRAWKAWSRAQHLHRLDLTTAEVSCTIRRLGGSVPSEPAAAVAQLLTMIREESPLPAS